MHDNKKIIKDVEINDCLLKLNEVLKLYLPSINEAEINKVIDLVRCGISVSLKQSSLYDVDFRYFIGSLASDKYGKYNLPQDLIKQINSIVASSDLITKIGDFAKKNQKENIDLFIPPVSLTIATYKLELRDDNNEYLYSSDKSQKGMNK